MRRIASHGPKRSVRASIRVESLEGRLLLTTTALPVNSSWSQVSYPLSTGTLVATPPAASSSSPSTIGNQAGPATSAPYSPTQLRHAYGVDKLTSLDGTGQTIAIVDAYADLSVASDLAKFDSYYSLPAANLVVATPEASQGTMTSDSGWALEVSLDVEWAHAIAPGAKILLVEAFSSNDSDLLNAVSYAVSQGASQVSMSWGGGEYSSEASLDSYFQTPGVTFLASSGDTGGQLLFPAISPYVTSVGGTNISLDAAGNRLSETAWSSAGGGQSAYITEPSFQKGFQSTGYRTTPDISYNADPASGVLVYDAGNWYQVGGTSASAPQWAGIMALANEGLVNAGKPTVGTGQAYGTNSVLYGLAGGSSYTNPNGDLLDITGGNNTHPATVGYDEATGLGVPLANQLVPDLIGPSAPAIPTVGDSSFESVVLPANNYSYNPTGSPWTFSGTSGLSGNGSGFTVGNPYAPQGNQVAFLQDTGSISQSIANWTAGSYTIAFDAAQRGNYGGVEDFQVLVDGVLVSTFKPTGTTYKVFTTAGFTVTAGSHVISFVGLNSAGGDDTDLIDAVSISVPSSTPPTPPTPPATPTVGDSGFESVVLPANNYSYNPTGSPWTFSGASGLSANNSGFTTGNPYAPQGNQVAFLQNTGSISQSIANWTAGSYTIAFDAAQRGNYGGVEDFQVLVDGVLVSTFKPTGTTYKVFTTAGFTVTAGPHVISFVGLNSAGGDDTDLIDAVSVATA